MRKRGEKQSKKVTLFLSNIRSAHNAGAIMRTADAAGVSEVVFGGFTPGPEDRFGRVRTAFTKASLGAEKNVPWRVSNDSVKELSRMKKTGSYLIAVEQTQDAVDYKKMKLPDKPTVIIMGNEVEGISSKVLRLVDTIVEIPMRGKKESLNVSVAAGIVLYRWFDC